MHVQRLYVGVCRVVQHTETDACCFIAQDTVDKCYIVSFRGTSTATNAMDDLKMNLVPFTMMEYVSPTACVLVFVAGNPRH